MTAVRFASFAEGHALEPMTARKGPELASLGYVSAEYAASGEATRYDVGERTFDGVWSAEPAELAPFTTRVLVRRPAAPADFSGVVICEWLNVSSGQDAAPCWTYLADEIVRQGHVWVGVSAQYMGVVGGTGAVGTATATGAQGLRQLQPERYGDLTHPGDAWSYSMFTQVAAALAEASPDHDAGPLSGLTVEKIVALGESQAAYALTSYVNAIAPLTGVFDGFFLHSRGISGMTTDDVDAPAVMERVVGLDPCRLRELPGAPTMIVEAEGDLIGRINYAPSRQPDGDWLRVWEIAGTAHADLFQIGEFESFLGCPTPINRGQMVWVLRAALRRLVEWVTEGTQAPVAPRLDYADGVFATDEVGNTTGGVRTPYVDAPTVRLVGVGAEGSSLVCQLFGQTHPADPSALSRRYASVEDYLTQYAAATDAAIEAGFVLVDDREEILAEADPETVAAALSTARSA